MADTHSLRQVLQKEYAATVLSEVGFTDWEAEQLLAIPRDTLGQSMSSAAVAIDSALATAADTSNDPIALVTSLLSGSLSRIDVMGKKLLLQPIRLFVSSTFTDTKHERNLILTDLVPRISKWCSDNLGVSFQVVDMRWGLRDEMTSDHRTLDMCIRELRRSIDESSSVCFLSLYADKYGFKPLPRTITQDPLDNAAHGPLLDRVLAVLESSGRADDVALIRQWYLRDDNFIDPTYVLQNVGSKYPNAFSNAPDAFEQRRLWWADESRLHAALTFAVKALELRAPSLEILFESITEYETRCAFASVPRNRIFWFRREILDPALTDSKITDFMEVDRSTSSRPAEILDALRRLRDDMTPQLPEGHYSVYKVGWEDLSAATPSFGSYAEGLMGDIFAAFVSKLSAELAALPPRALLARSHGVLREVLVHANIAAEKARSFNPLLCDATQAVADARIARRVIAIVGPRGCGKTALVARLAAEGRGSDDVRLLRFVGASPKSATGGDILASLVAQVELLAFVTTKAALAFLFFDF